LREGRSGDAASGRGSRIIPQLRYSEPLTNFALEVIASVHP
jgi:hypothetical protein